VDQIVRRHEIRAKTSLDRRFGQCDAEVRLADTGDPKT
jgi:hypothetical protein